MYTIKIINIHTDKELSLRYKDKQEAMDQWDKVVDNAIPGQKVRLIHNDRISSEYEPMNNRRGNQWLT